MFNFFQAQQNNNNIEVQPFLEKLKNNQLTIEDVLNEDIIFKDLFLNDNSRFLSIISNETIRKCIDYAINLPSSDEDKRYKYAFRATKLLCNDNAKIVKIILNKIKYVEDSEEKEEKEKKEKNKFLSIISFLIPNKKEKIITIYNNVDYLLQFLDSSEEILSNRVLVGYFCKILNHIIDQGGEEIITYLYDYPKKKEFDVFNLLIKNINNRGICEIINRLLLYNKNNKNNEENVDEIFKQ